VRVDLYRWAGVGSDDSYLAVPEGEIIPNEATNVEWSVHLESLDIGEAADALSDYAIDRPVEQINVKGYAITRCQGVQSSNRRSH